MNLRTTLLLGSAALALAIAPVPARAQARMNGGHVQISAPRAAMTAARPAAATQSAARPHQSLPGNGNAGSRWGHNGNQWHGHDRDWWRHHHHFPRYYVYSGFYDPFFYGYPFGYGYGGYGYGYGVPYYGASADLYYNGTRDRGYEGRTGSLAIEVQRRLARAGYYNGSIDGVIGNGTRRAIRAYERAHGLPVDGRIDDQLLDRMGLS